MDDERCRFNQMLHSMLHSFDPDKFHFPDGIDEELDDNSFKKNVLGVEVNLAVRFRFKKKPVTVAEQYYVRRLERKIDDILDAYTEVLSEALNRAYNEV